MIKLVLIKDNKDLSKLLTSHIKALIKHSKKEGENFVFKGFLGLENCLCFLKKEQIRLLSLKFELLKCFFENKNTVLSREFLAECVLDNTSTNDKTINIALKRLWVKFIALKAHIQSIFGIGCKLC